MRALVVGFALLLAGPASGQAVLAFDAEVADLGRVAEGTAPSHTFRVTNTGDAPLAIADIEAACGCTTPAFPTAPIAPGASAEVAVTYDTAGRPGPFEKAVYVRAEGVPPVTLRLTGTVTPALAQTGVRLGALAFDATETDAGAIPAGGRLQQAFRFANVGDAPVRIERVEAPDGVAVVFPDRPLVPDGLAGLFVTADDIAPLTEAGRVEILLTLHTTDAETPAKRLVLRAEVAPVASGER
ncbi:MAG: DUF1573 domain-containing protein [Bacteroidota bacterium]